MGKFKLAKKKKPIPKADPKCQEDEHDYVEHILKLIDGLSDEGFKVFLKWGPVGKTAVEGEIFAEKFEDSYLDYIFRLIKFLSESGYRKFLKRKVVPPLTQEEWDKIITDESAALQHIGEIIQELEPETIMEYVNHLRPWLIDELEERYWDIEDFREVMIKKYGEFVHLEITRDWPTPDWS